MQRKENLKFDGRWFGFIAGIIIPLITLFLFYMYRNPQSFKLFYDQVLTINILSRLVSLCVLPNLLVFFVFIWTNRYKSAHGVIGATFVYALIVLILTQL